MSGKIEKVHLCISLREMRGLIRRSLIIPVVILFGEIAFKKKKFLVLILK